MIPVAESRLTALRALERVIPFQSAFVTEDVLIRAHRGRVIERAVPS